MKMNKKWPYKTLAIGEGVHTDIRIAAAKAGVSKKEMAERAFRLGLDAGRWQQSAAELAEALKSLEYEVDKAHVGMSSLHPGCAVCRALSQARTALAAYEAAREGEN